MVFRWNHRAMENGLERGLIKHWLNYGQITGPESPLQALSLTHAVYTSDKISIFLSSYTS